MEIVSKTIFRQIITQCAGAQDIIKKLASCDPCGRKSGLKTVAFLLRLSICNWRVKIGKVHWVTLCARKVCRQQLLGKVLH